MPLSFCILGSGSGGNSTLLALGAGDQRRYILIDAGLSPRMTTKRMGPLGLTLADVSDIVLTHLDSDHFHQGWINGIEKHNIQLHFHRRQRTRAIREMLNFKRVNLFEDAFELNGEGTAHLAAVDMAGAGNQTVGDVHPTSFNCIHFAHDDLGTVGFVVEHDSLRLGFATDVGRVPDSMFDCFRDLHALAIESNYDHDMQLASRRPPFLKKRIMGGRGHLCNEQSIDAVTRIAHQSRLSHIALLHLSRQCNCPRLVQSLYARKAPHLLPVLTVSSQVEPTPMLHVAVGKRCSVPPPPRRSEQMVMF